MSYTVHYLAKTEGTTTYKSRRSSHNLDFEEAHTFIDAIADANDGDDTSFYFTALVNDVDGCILR